MVRPNNPHRRREAFKILANFFHKSHRWPRQIQKIVYEHRNCNNRERFIVFVFFLNNGLAPDHAYEVMDKLWFLDADSERQLKYLREMWDKGYPYWKWTSWEIR